MKRSDSIPINTVMPDDPELDALLDEALAAHSVAGGVPAGLSKAILARTQRPQARLRTSVIARIDRTPWLRALAASIAVSATLGILLASSGIVHDGRNLYALNQDLNNLRLVTPRVESVALVTAEPSPKALAIDASKMGSTLDDVESAIEQELGSLPHPSDGDPEGGTF